MSEKTDFGPLEGWPHKRFDETFDWVEQARQVIGSGAGILAGEHAYLKNKFARLIAQNWELWEPGQPWRHGSGDRGGFLGFGQNDPMGIATKIVKPIEVAAERLQEAQLYVVKFRPAFERWMEPYNYPRRSTVRGDGYDERPGQRGGAW